MLLATNLLLMHPQSDSLILTIHACLCGDLPTPLAVMATWSWGRAVILIVGGGGGCRVVGVVQMMHCGTSVCLPPPPSFTCLCTCASSWVLSGREYADAEAVSMVTRLFSGLRCGACVWPLLQVSVNVSARAASSQRRNDTRSLLLPQVSLLEYRKRKQGGRRDSESAGSSTSMDGAHPRPGSHYRNDSHHTHSHQRRQPPASPNTSFTTSTRSPSIPQTEDVGLPEHPGSSQKPKLQDSSSQWWVTMSSRTPGQTNLCFRSPHRVSPGCIFSAHHLKHVGFLTVKPVLSPQGWFPPPWSAWERARTWSEC